MSKVYMISDLHFGHKNIMNFAGAYRDGDTYLENMHTIIANWNGLVRKRDIVYVLGDVVMDPQYFPRLNEMNGQKILIRGNHDKYPLEEYLKYFKDIHGFKKYKKFWLSHAPIHPHELRGRDNIHGHVHQNTILNGYHEPDDRYVNVCVENTGGFPIAYEDIEGGWRKS